jgi:hypothetical protein
VTNPRDLLELRPDGPHTPAYTVQVAWGLAEAVRVLNYATTHAAAGLTTPATAYDVIGATKTAAQRLPQLFDQLSNFLERELDAGRLADHVREPAAAVETALMGLSRAGEAADEMERELERAQAAINGLYIPDPAAGGENQ